MTMNVETLLKDIFDYDSDGPNIHHLMEGYCKLDSIPEMKKNVFKTESGKYLLKQMFVNSKR